MSLQRLLTKSYKAAAALTAFRIAAFNANAAEVAPATASTDRLAGIVDSTGAEAGTMADIHRVGIWDVRAGGTFAAGDLLTSDATGRAVKAVKPGAGVVLYTIGQAEAPALENDLVPILINPGVIVG